MKSYAIWSRNKNPTFFWDFPSNKKTFYPWHFDDVKVAFKQETSSGCQRDAVWRKSLKIVFHRKCLWIKWRSESRDSFDFGRHLKASKPIDTPPPTLIQHPVMRRKISLNYLARESLTYFPAVECLSVSAPLGWHVPISYVQVLKLTSTIIISEQDW